MPALQALLDKYLSVTTVALRAERLPFEIDERVVGSVTPADAALLAATVPGVAMANDALQILPVCSPDGPAVLAAIARALFDAGRIAHWRDELLPVCADDGTMLGAIERACVRALGVRTFAVHMVGECLAPDAPDDYAVWLQRRAPDKSVDPGLLDTLAGGLIGVEPDGTMEALHLGLQREVSEEAGLQPGQYGKPVRVTRWRLSSPVAEGHMIEDCTVYRARLADNVVPENRDGEVSEFMRVSRARLLSLIADDQLTYTASAAALLALQDFDRQNL